MEKKKIIIISIISVIIVLAIIGTVFYIINRNSEENNVNYANKVEKLYNTLNKKEKFTFTTIKDDNNKEIYAKNQNAAYIYTIYNGEQSKYIIKDGNSYFLNDENKIYYTYQNNEIELNKVLEQLQTVVEAEELTQGQEEIEGKLYDYVEYPSFTNFALSLSDEGNSENIKTRFYFDNDDLIYIKTIMPDAQDMLKVEISYKVEDNLFEIPSDYRKM